jgi:hypothetical protein
VGRNPTMKKLFFTLLTLFFSYHLFAQSFQIKASDTLGCVGESITLSASSGFAFYTWSTGDSIREIKVKKTAWYSVKALNRNGKWVQDSIYIRFVYGLDLKVFSNPKNATICPGDSLVLEANSGFKSYYWQDLNTRGNRAVYFPQKSGKIVVEATDSNGCEDRVEWSYTVKDTCNKCNIIEVEGGSNPCGVDSAKIEVDKSFDTYKWSDGETGRVRWVKKSGWYKVKACRKNECCEDSVYVQFHKKKAFNLDADPRNATICKGDEITFEATRGMKKYGWNLTKSDDYKIKIKPEKSGSVVVEATDSNGCEYRYVKYFTVKDTCTDSCDILEVWPKKTACIGDTISLEVKYGFSSYTWSDGEKGRLRYATKSGWYKIKACDGSSCCEDSVYLTFSKSKTLKLYSSPSLAVVCKGDKIVVEASGGFKKYWWNMSTSHDNRIVFEAERSGKVVVEAEDSNGCGSRAVLEYTVKDTCSDSCDIIEYWPEKTVCQGDTIILEVKSGFKTYSWSDGKKGRVRYVTKTGWYKVEACDGRDCCTDSIYLKVHEKKKFELGTNVKRNTICLGDTLIVEATSGMKGYWFSTGHRVRFFKMVPEKSFKLVVEAVDANGCEYRKELYITVDSCTSSIQRITAPSLEWTVQNGHLSIQSDQPVQLKVYSMLGQQLYSSIDRQVNHQVPYTHWPSGTILVLVNKSGGTTTFKWIRVD